MRYDMSMCCLELLTIWRRRRWRRIVEYDPLPKLNCDLELFYGQVLQKFSFLTRYILP